MLKFIREQLDARRRQKELQSLLLLMGKIEKQIEDERKREEGGELCNA